MQRADKRTYHYIYKITRDDGKYYIGMHSTDSLEDGYFGSGKLITRSIKKYGVERHKKEILEFLPSRIQLKERERELVNEEILDDPRCMNLQLGGGGGWANNPNSLIPLRDPIIKKKIGVLAAKTIAARRENQEYRDSYAQKISEAVTGNQNWLGKSHTKKTKAKMSASAKGKHDGEKNSQFGTCWITNGVKAIKIKKDLLDEYLKNGYQRGRGTLPR